MATSMFLEKKMHSYVFLRDKEVNGKTTSYYGCSTTMV